MDQHEPAPAENPETLKHQTYFCNRCPVSAIVANIANETPERIELARNTCIACKGHKQDAPYWTDGQTWVHFDGAESGSEYAMTMADPLAMPNHRKRRNSISDASEAVENAVLSILRTFAAMTSEEVRDMNRRKHCRKICDAIVCAIPEAEEASRKVLGILLELRETQLLAMWGLMQGMSYADIARKVGLSKQAIHKAALMAYSNHPELLSLAPDCNITIRNIEQVRQSVERTESLKRRYCKRVLKVG